MRTSLLLPALLFSTAATAQTGNVGIGTTTPSDQLHTTGTVRHEGYRSSGTRLVQMDSSGRLIVTGGGPVSTNNTITGIPDNGCGAGTGATSAITINGLPASVPASKIAVRVRITHPSVAHLRIFLIGPGANIICLANPANAGANYTNTIFTDEGLVNINSATLAAQPFTGKYKPSGNTTALCNGAQATVATFGAMGGGSVNPNTTWTLKVYDAFSAFSGTLDGWEISFSGPESFVTAQQNNYVPLFSSGNLTASNFFQSGPSIGLNTSAPLSTLHVADQGDALGLLANVNALASGTGAFLDFRTGTQFTGRVGTTGTGTQDASLGFYTGATGTASGLQKRLSILDGGNVGIGLADNFINERLHVDGGHLRIGRGTWSTTATDRFIKFGDGEYVTIGETGDDDDMQLTGEQFYFRALNGQTNVGINNPAPAQALDVTGNAVVSGSINAASLGTTGGASIGGSLTAASLGTTGGGTIASSGGLSVAGNTALSGNLKVQGGAPAAGKVLTATNSGGGAVWVAPQKVSFRAYLPSNVNATTGPVLTASGYTEEHDDGGAFNPSTGIFTAPVAGTYHFDVLARVVYYVSYSGYQGISVGLDFSAGVEDVSVINYLTFAEEKVVTFSQTVKLAAGTTVSVRCQGSTAGYSVKSDVDPTLGPYRSWFSGHLVH